MILPQKIKRVPHLIEEILADLTIYIEPKLLKKEFSDLLDMTLINKDGIKKYYELLSNVRYAWEKTIRYAQYFEEFYPSTDQIEKFEALNHHIHAYLQDLTILKNKIVVLLGAMKNDIKKNAINKDDVEFFLNAGIAKTMEVFNEVSKYRDPHTHKGMRFLDGDLFKAENAYKSMEIFTSPEIDKMLNQGYKPKLLEKFKKEKEESFDAGKQRWIAMALENNEQISGFLDAILEDIKLSLYQFLNINSIKDVMGSQKGN